MFTDAYTGLKYKRLPFVPWQSVAKEFWLQRKAQHRIKMSSNATNGQVRADFQVGVVLQQLLPALAWTLRNLCPRHGLAIARDISHSPSLQFFSARSAFPPVGFDGLHTSQLILEFLRVAELQTQYSSVLCDLSHMWNLHNL